MDDDIQRKRKKSMTVFVFIIDIILIIMSIGFFAKSNYVGGLIALVLFILFTIVLFIMRKTKIQSANWKA